MNTYLGRPERAGAGYSASVSASEESVVLHALRVGGVLGLDELTARTGFRRSGVDQVLVELERASMVRRNSGVLSGWSLTGAGRARGESLLAEELDSLGARPGVLALYGQFGVVNAELLVICTDWQVRAGVDPPELNDHADASYDATVLDRLGGLHDRACEMLDELEGLLPRFAGYRPRLDTALDRAGGGDVDWVTKPMIDSYHTVWFELHEDLLATLGRQRSDEVGC